jgi:hypothetical protein
MEKGEELAKQNGKEGVRLRSVPDALGFYRKLGYQNTENCELEDDHKRKVFTLYGKRQAVIAHLTTLLTTAQQRVESAKANYDEALRNMKEYQEICI